MLCTFRGVTLRTVPLRNQKNDFFKRFLQWVVLIFARIITKLYWYFGTKERSNDFFFLFRFICVFFWTISSGLLNFVDTLVLKNVRMIFSSFSASFVCFFEQLAMAVLFKRRSIPEGIFTGTNLNVNRAIVNVTGPFAAAATERRPVGAVLGLLLAARVQHLVVGRDPVLVRSYTAAAELQFKQINQIQNPSSSDQKTFLLDSKSKPQSYFPPPFSPTSRCSRSQTRVSSALRFDDAKSPPPSHSSSFRWIPEPAYWEWNNMYKSAHKISRTVWITHGSTGRSGETKSITLFGHPGILRALAPMTIDWLIDWFYPVIFPSLHSGRKTSDFMDNFSPTNAQW